VPNFMKVDPNAITPKYETARCAGFDLACVEPITFNATHTEPRLFSTGLVIATPPEHMLYITFRSSTPRRHGIIVYEGILDEDYCGNDDICKLQIGPRPDKVGENICIPEGTRIAQGIFVPITRKPLFTEVEDMGESRGGFGSTG
jgi:dUTP pyrophosphatase